MDTLSIPGSTLYPVGNPGGSPIYSWLTNQPKATVLELPAYLPQLDIHADRWLTAQYASISHWNSTPAGYSGFVPPRHADLLLLFNRFPREEVLDLLRAMNVRYVIIHIGELEAAHAIEVASTLDRLGLAVKQFGKDLVVTLPSGGTTSAAPAARYVIPTTPRANRAATVSVVYTSEGPTVMPPNSPMGSLVAEWRKLPAGKTGEDGKVVRSDRVWFQPPFYVNGLGMAPVEITSPEQPGAYLLTLQPGQGGESVSGQVTVIEDVASPDILPVPVRLLSSEVHCSDTGPILSLTMQTIGWYDQPFSLSAQIHDAAGDLVAQNDLEFPPLHPRANLLEVSEYQIPFEKPIPVGQYTVELFAYQWQQAAERTVQRYFLSQNGEPLDKLGFGVDVPPCPVPTP